MLMKTLALFQRGAKSCRHDPIQYVAVMYLPIRTMKPDPTPPKKIPAKQTNNLPVEGPKPKGSKFGQEEKLRKELETSEIFLLCPVKPVPSLAQPTVFDKVYAPRPGPQGLHPQKDPGEPRAQNRFG